jgi:4-hydroxy-3-polyprenylbenzoate decarboxylase
MLDALPIITCWPDDGGPFITLPAVLTQDVKTGEKNLGMYRLQKYDNATTGMHWHKHHDGNHAYQHAKELGKDRVEVAVALGAAPHVVYSATAPLPKGIYELLFAGFVHQQAVETVPAKTVKLDVPAHAEIILEGYVLLDETRWDGPFGDHTGYYNEQDWFPVFTVDRITMRRNPIYHSTYTGKPPDEPAVLGVALNEVFVPILRRQLPEIVDFYLPPEGCSYRLAVVSIRKQYPGHAKRVMFGLWSILRQFMYTKFIVVVDADINPRDWKEVVWAMTTRMDPVRDTLLVENTPIDYLDFASPVSGLGGKMGLDATNKWAGETQREWGTPIQMDAATKTRVDAMWNELGLF